MYPIEANADLVVPDQIAAYLEMLFGLHDFEPGEWVSFRPVGENGTVREGVMGEITSIEPVTRNHVRFAIDAAPGWAAYGWAGFVVPAILKTDLHARVGDVKLMTTLLVDLDSGDTDAKLAHVAKHAGKPTMVVYSGGVTETGQPKLHVYWRLNEATDDIALVSRLRDTLARKVGGDIQFGIGKDGNPLGRAHQPIRMAGTVHGKGGTARQVAIRSQDGPDHELADLAERIEAMPAMEGIALPVAAPTLPTMAAGGVMDFKTAWEAMPPAAVTDVHAGGNPDGANRWNNFSEVAGHYIMQARNGLISIEEAERFTHGWMLAHMKPTWPEHRFANEWRGLLTVDARNHGPLVPPQPIVPLTPPPVAQSGDWDLLDWAVTRRSSLAPEPRRFLVQGWFMAGKRHMFVAEGGAGKTFSMMDLALRLAAKRPGDGMVWFGEPVTDYAAGGTVVLLTAEDDVDELDIRWNAIDPHGRLRGLAGENLIVLPLDNLGGAFPLVALQRGEAGLSPRWADMIERLRRLAASGRNVTAVIIDTLNSTLHGEENSAAVISDYLRALAPVTGELGAAVIITHHTRKAGQLPIRTPADMREAVRGSTALINGMRVVIGMWHAPEWKSRLEAMGEHAAPRRLFQMAVIKANNPDMSETVKVLMRAPQGGLIDVTHRDIFDTRRGREQRAWLAHAVAEAARGRYPFTTTGTRGVEKRRNELPALLSKMSGRRLVALVEECLDAGLICKANLASGQKTYGNLDVPDGPVATGQGYVDAGSWKVPDWSQWEYDPEMDMVALR